jgi:peptidyl-prolyl cis-trans isomerase B (cyclophilin B)
MANPIVTIEMEDGGKIVAELYPEIAPETVNNFVYLAGQGFYDGLIFHRVISGFMIQGGDPLGDGTGGPGYCIKGEFLMNGVKNELSHKRGVLSMARAGHPNSAGSQFFIMHQDSKFLNNQYAAFGKVLEGMDVVDQIAAVKTDSNDRPKTEQKMKKVTVDTQGQTYPEPNKLPDPFGRY